MPLGPDEFVQTVVFFSSQHCYLSSGMLNTIPVCSRDAAFEFH